MKTRRITENSIVGQPEKLPINQLPTCASVFRAVLHYTKMHMTKSKSEVATIVAEQVKEIYDRSGIPTIQIPGVVMRIKRLIMKIEGLRKYTTDKKASSNFQKQFDSIENIFDICSCKCFTRGIRDRPHCTCPLASKVPLSEWEFWIDQNTRRQMIIGKLDHKVNRKLECRSKRRKLSSTDVCKAGELLDDLLFDNMLDTELDNTIDDNDFEIPSQESVSDENESDTDYHVTYRNTHEYPELCKAMDRCKISNRNACLIANAMLKDLGILTPVNAIDPAKLRRQRKAMRKNAIDCQDLETKELICIGFDGKRDMTVVNKSGIRRSIKEEHYTIVAFPPGNYVDHITPESSKANDVVNEILSCLTHTRSLESLSSVLCDGTVNNTGKYGGIIRKLEESLRRPIQWIICLLHTNELPFRKYISVVGGGQTTGPSSSTCPIMSDLSFDPMNLPISNFTPISGKVVGVTDEIMKNLSFEQLYLLKACLVIQNGLTKSDDRTFFETAMPGFVHNARWLTTANRILRLYMSQTQSSEALGKIVRFILNVYAPSWFYIKQHSSCFDGAKNYYFLTKLCFDLGPEDWNIVKGTLLNNSYFAHPENVLLAGILDKDESIRKFAYQKILHARASNIPGHIRLFDKAGININPTATSFIDMIEWNSDNYASPPLLRNISNDELLNCSFGSLLHIPCHSQLVERTVQQISSTSCKVYGHDARHGMVIQSRRSIAEKPNLNNKLKFL